MIGLGPPSHVMPARVRCQLALQVPPDLLARLQAASAVVPIPWVTGPSPPTRGHPKGFGRAPADLLTA
jgi:hypothetical protein